MEHTKHTAPNAPINQKKRSDPFPFYHVDRSFEENIRIPIEHTVHQKIQHDFGPCTLLGYDLSCPLGVAACAMTTGRGIKLASDLGFSVLTYKTIRAYEKKSHPVPNVCYVACNKQLELADLQNPLHATTHAPSSNQLVCIANSVGNASTDTEWTQRDIALARASTKGGQVLIVSVYGEGEDVLSAAQEFVAAAFVASDAGAQVIEVNLSCPNVAGKRMYTDAEWIYTIVSAVCSAVDLPVVVKVGICKDAQQLKECLYTSARAGARGVCGLNTVPVTIKREHTGESYFGSTRITSGLSGYPIRSLAQQFVADAMQIITSEQLDLELIATGGVTQAEHFKDFLDTGASAAQCATAFMYNPFFMV